MVYGHEMTPTGKLLQSRFQLFEQQPYCSNVLCHKLLLDVSLKLKILSELFLQLCYTASACIEYIHLWQKVDHIEICSVRNPGRTVLESNKSLCVRDLSSYIWGSTSH